MAFSDPQKNIDQLGIAEGMRVADLGCGSGFYTIAAAKKVGPDGTVFAVDIQQELLSRLKQEVASEEEMGSVEVVWGDIADPGSSKLGDGSVEVALLCNVLFQVEDKQAVFLEAHRILKPGGRVLIVEWSDSFGGLGPETKAVVSEQQARGFAEDIGFSIVKDIDAGDHHYGFVAKKAS